MNNKSLKIATSIMEDCVKCIRCGSLKTIKVRVASTFVCSCLNCGKKWKLLNC